MSNFFFKGGPGALQGTAALGVSSVADVNKVVGTVPFRLRVTSVKVYQQADITGTGLTMDLFARTTAGAAGNSLLASTVSLDVANAAAGKAGQSATLSATKSNLILSKGQMLEAVFDATSVTAGPGDVTVVVEFTPLV